MSQESSLIKTSKNIRKVILVFLAVVVVNLTWNYGAKVIEELKKNAVLSQYTPFKEADNAFGEISLPPIDPILPIGDQSNINFTLTGNFRNFQNRMEVYQVSKPKETFMTVTKAQQSAQRIGFKEELKNPNDNVLRWEGEGRLLTMDKDGIKWNLNSDESFINMLVTKVSGDGKLEDALKDAVDAISGTELQFTENLNYVQPTTYFVQLNQDSPLGVSRVEEGDSNFLLLSFDEFVDALPLKITGKADEAVSVMKIPKKAKIYTSNPYLGRMHAMFYKNYIREDSIISLKFSPINLGKTGIYKIISPKEALTRLQESNGSLRALKTNLEKTFEEHEALNVSEFNIIAEETDLGYFVEDEVTKDTYTYPIYVFNGNAKLEGGEVAEFTFYVDALDFN